MTTKYQTIREYRKKYFLNYCKQIYADLDPLQMEFMCVNVLTGELVPYDEENTRDELFKIEFCSYPVYSPATDEYLGMQFKMFSKTRAAYIQIEDIAGELAVYRNEMNDEENQKDE